MEACDDFERFCQIAQRSPRDSLSPNDTACRAASRSGRRATQGNYLDTLGTDGLVRRSSSFRESRRGSSIHGNRHRSGGGGAVGFGNGIESRSPGGRMDYRLAPAVGDIRRASSSHQRITATNEGQQIAVQNRGYANDIPEWIDQAGVRSRPHHYTHGGSNREKRNRSGSMKETRRTPVAPKSTYRPSAPALYPTGLSPDYRCESHSPGRFPANATEDNTVRVRRFQRKKSGQIISKGDQNMIQADLFQPLSPTKALSGRGDRPKPTIYTDQISGPSDSSDCSSRASASDTDVIEIPAITTTLIQPSSEERDSLAPKSAFHSPNTLRPEMRNRSRSWAVVSEPYQFQNSTPSCSSPTSDCAPMNGFLTVQVLGMSRVGKSSLCLQFQTSESLDVALDCAAEDESPRTVTVEVNNVKFNLELIDTDLNEDESCTDFDPPLIESADAYVVVYAMDDGPSFDAARSIVSHLLVQCKRSSAIVLVANKSDLVRRRVVSVEAGKNLAGIYACPFYEISTSLNHQVDELLVGIVVAVQEKRLEADKERSRLEKMGTAQQRASVTGAGRRRSLGAGLKSQKSGLIKFFQKHFTRN